MKSNASYLVDTDVIIRQLRGRGPANRELQGYSKSGRLAIAAITSVEVHAGSRPEQRFETARVLSRYLTIEMDRRIADRAGALIWDQRRRGITLAAGDAIIAATALVHNLALLTLNRAHFASIPGLSLAPLSDDVT